MLHSGLIQNRAAHAVDHSSKALVSINHNMQYQYYSELAKASMFQITTAIECLASLVLKHRSRNA
jgi:hypothetical protein